MLCLSGFEVYSRWVPLFSTFSFVMFDSYENLFGRNDRDVLFLLTVITSSYFYILFRQNM